MNLYIRININSSSPSQIEDIGYVPDDPVTIPFDYVRFGNRTGSPDLPLDKPPCVKLTTEEEPEQIHIALAGLLSHVGMCCTPSVHH